jgi:type I restriction enzyme S subunit
VDHINDFRFDGHYVLLAEDGGYFDEPARGVAYEASGKFWVNNHAHILEPLGGIPVSFLRYALNAIDWMPHVSGTTRLKLTQAGLQKVAFPVPPLNEQRRIVAKIDSLAGKSKRVREQLDHVPRLVEKYKQAVLAATFRGEISDADARSTNKGKGLWDVPQDWNWRTISDVGEVGLGRQRSPKDHEGPQMRRYVRAANITWNGWDLTNVKEMNFDDQEFARFKLKAGDVLINEGSGSAKEVGKPAIWREQISECCFQNTLLRVQPKVCSSEYLYWYFLYSAMAGHFVSSTQGVNIFHIGKEGLAKFPIPVPPNEQQKKLVAHIEQAFTWIDRLAVEATAARKLVDHLDQGVLAKAFRGELVQQDPADEPASVLLNRIKAQRTDGQPGKTVKGSKGLKRSRGHH